MLGHKSVQLKFLAPLLLALKSLTAASNKIKQDLLAVEEATEAILDIATVG